MEDKPEKIKPWKPEMPLELAIQELEWRRAAARRMGGKEFVERQHKLGKLTVRERIDRLVDKGSFFEMGRITGEPEYDEEGNLVNFLPAGFVCGVAEIDGRPVTVAGEDNTVAGGAESGYKSFHFFNEPYVIQNLVPMVKFLDGAGASGRRYEQAGKMVIARSQVGWWWSTQALKKVPVASACLGPCAGGAAAHVVLSHFSVMVKGMGQVFPSGPPLVSRSLGYKVDKEELGGYKVQTRLTGTVDNEAEDEDDAFQQIKTFLSCMPSNIYEVPERKDLGDDPNRREEELLGVVPAERKKPYNIYKVIRLLVDKGEFFEMRKHYGGAAITAFARFDGYPVAIVASNPNVDGGGINGNVAQKVERFIDMACLFNVPIVALADTPGLMIGMDAEKTGTVRYGMRAVMAAADATVPKVQICLRKGYGIGFGMFNSITGMLSPDMRFGWPTGEWGPIPIEGGVAAAYRRVIEAAPDPEAKRKEIENRILQMRSPFSSAEGGDIMEIIDPRETRVYICRFIKAAQLALRRNASLPKRTVRC